jgi:hypothetical protein
MVWLAWVEVAKKKRKKPEILRFRLYLGFDTWAGI